MNLITKIIAWCMLAGTMVVGHVPAYAESSAPLTSQSFTTSTTDYPNPERGWTIYASDMQNLTLSELQGYYNTTTYQSVSTFYRIAFTRINLSAYTKSAIPQSFINTLSTAFGYARAAGVKLKPRIVYNYDSSGTDATLAQMQAHLAQLKPLLYANADVIVFAEAGMIGAYGEWWGSTNSLDTNTAAKANIRDALLSAYPPQTYVSFRYPRDFINWYPSAVSATGAANGSAISRAGMHNDCFMADNQDAGTYQSSSLTNNSERNYVMSQSERVPFGGETCVGNVERTTCSSILQEGAQYHLMSLGRTYNLDFFNAWISGGCYAQVAQTVGYRFQLDSLSHQNAVTRGDTMTFNVLLRDVGWSRIISARKLNVTLVCSVSGTCGSDAVVLKGAMDFRLVPSQMTSSMTVRVNGVIPASIRAGVYNVYLSLPDPNPSIASRREFMVRWANNDNGSAGTGQAWNDTLGRTSTGTQVTVN